MRSILSVSSLILGALSAGCTDSPTSLHQALSSRLVVQPRVDTLAGKGAIIHLTATVGGRDTVASWTSLNDGVATVDSLGTAHSVGAGAAKIVATVGGLADTATLIVLTGVLLHVDLAPASVTLPPAGTIQFAVSGTWTDGSSTAPAVTYSATGGTITPDGLYTAGVAPGIFAVIATQQGGTTADTSTVTITVSAPTLTQLVLTPASVKLAPAGTSQFAVSGTWSDGSSTVPAVTYSATGGTITAGGLYTAGTTGGTFQVIATQQGGSKADTSTVTIALAPPTLTQLVLTPTSVTLAPAGTSQFVVSGTWSDGSSTVPAVTYSATGGTITAGGLFTASTTSGTFHVIAIQQGGTKADTSAVTVTAASAPTLRRLATARHFAMGAAVRDSAFRNDAQYLQTLVTQYNSIVPEDATDFWPIHPGPSQYAFAAADALVSFAQANGMVIHGHTLSWYAWIPTWITGGGYTNDQLRAILKDHITTVVGRYSGRIASWDVVNEVENESGTGLRSSYWVDHLGPEYIDSAFVWAHRADPAAKLYLNDYATETINPKSDAVLALAQALKGRGVPIDGVGFQMHILQFSPPPTSAQIQANFARFASAGFDIRITELDVDVADTAGAAALASQGATYSAVLDACLRVPRCLELTTWGFTDKYNWIPQSFPGFGRALPFNSTYQPKPAFDSLVVRLGQP